MSNLLLAAVLLGVMQIGPSLADCSVLATPHRYQMGVASASCCVSDTWHCYRSPPTQTKYIISVKLARSEATWRLVLMNIEILQNHWRLYRKCQFPNCASVVLYKMGLTMHMSLPCVDTIIGYWWTELAWSRVHTHASSRYQRFGGFIYRYQTTHKQQTHCC